jgi:hypothetical protein
VIKMKILPHTHTPLCIIASVTIIAPVLNPSQSCSLAEQLVNLTSFY